MGPPARRRARRAGVADGAYRLAGLASAPYNVSVEDPTGMRVAAAHSVEPRLRQTEQLPDLIVPFKRPLYEAVLAEFAGLITPAP